MQLYLVTWTNSKLQKGKKDFIVKDAFDNNDAISKVKKQIASLLSVGETFEAKMIVFNEYETFVL